MTNVDPTEAGPEATPNGTRTPPTGRLTWALNVMSEDAAAEPGFLAGLTAVAAAVVVGICRLIHMGTITSHHMVVGWGGVSLVCLIAIGCLTLLGVVFWQSRVNTRTAGAYSLTLIASLLAISVSIEAFAGVTTLLWHEHVISPHAQTGPSLWSAERFYLWQLVDSVPLLDITEKLQWKNPLPMSDGVSGGILLGFKIVVIAPLIRLAIGAYQFIEAQAVAERGKRHELDQRVPGGTTRPYWLAIPAGTWRMVARVLGITMAGFLAGFVLVEPESPVAHWTSTNLSNGFTIAGHHVPLAWLPNALPWIAVVLLLRCLYSANDEMWFLQWVWLDNISKVLAVVIAQVCLIGLVFASAGAGTMALSNAGVTMMRPPTDTGSVFGASCVAYVWHVTDALPGPDIPQTLNWTLPHDLTGITSGALLLLVEVTVFAILVFPTARAARIYLHHARPRPAVQAALSAAREFGELCATAQSTLDAYEREATARWRKPPPLPGGPGVGMGALRVSAFGLSTAGSWEAAQAITAVVESLDRVTALFGDGELPARAETVATALHVRHELLTTIKPSTWDPTILGARPFGPTPHRGATIAADDLFGRRAEAEAAIRAYRITAAELLRQEATVMTKSQTTQAG